jgi:hypothetical protein
MKRDPSTGTKQAGSDTGLQWDLVLFGTSCNGVLAEYYGDMGTSYACGSIVNNCDTFYITYNNNNQFEMRAYSSEGVYSWSIGQYTCYNNAQHQFVTGSSFQLDLHCNM